MRAEESCPSVPSPEALAQLHLWPMGVLRPLGSLHPAGWALGLCGPTCSRKGARDLVALCWSGVKQIENGGNVTSKPVFLQHLLQ